MAQRAKELFPEGAVVPALKPKGKRFAEPTNEPSESDRAVEAVLLRCGK